MKIDGRADVFLFCFPRFLCSRLLSIADRYSSNIFKKGYLINSSTIPLDGLTRSFSCFVDSPHDSGKMGSIKKNLVHPTEIRASTFTL